MSEPAELERRVASIEDRLELEGGLRASQDRDLSAIKMEVQATQTMIKAAGRIASDHERSLRRLGDRLDGVDERLGILARSVDVGFERVDSRLDGTDARFDGVDSRLDGVQASLADHGERLSNVDERLSNVDERLSNVDERLSNVEDGVRQIVSLLTAGEG